MNVPLIFSFWFMVAAYVIHCSSAGRTLLRSQHSSRGQFPNLWQSESLNLTCDRRPHAKDFLQHKRSGELFCFEYVYYCAGGRGKALPAAVMA